MTCAEVNSTHGSVCSNETRVRAHLNHHLRALYTLDAQCDKLSQLYDLCALYDRLDGRYRRFRHDNRRQLRRRLHRHTHIAYTRVLPILRQISSLVYPKIQRKQVIMNVLHPGCAQPPRWSPPVLWRRFEDGLASICILNHSCKMPKESERTTGLNDVRKWWLACNACSKLNNTRAAAFLR